MQSADGKSWVGNKSEPNWMWIPYDARRSAKERRPAVETLRGLAAILLVAFHCIEGEPFEARGTLGYAYFGYSVVYIRVPLFTVISGFVYALRPITPGNGLVFIKAKVRRLLLPLFSLLTIEVIIGIITSDVNSAYTLEKVGHTYLFHHTYLWFLQSIFIVFIVISILEEHRSLQKLHHWLAALGIAALFATFPPLDTEFLSIRGFFYLLPFFLLGLGLHRFHHVFFFPFVFPAILVVGIIGISYQQLVWWNPTFEYIAPSENNYHIIITLACIIIVFRLKRAWTPLTVIGGFSYSIYLFHPLTFPIGHWFMSRLMNVSQPDVLFLSRWLSGLFLPIGLELLIRQHKLPRRLLLGLR